MMKNGYLIFKPNKQGVWRPQVVKGTATLLIDAFQYDEIPYSNYDGFLIESHPDLGVRILFYDKARFSFIDQNGNLGCAIADLSGFLHYDLNKNYDVAAQAMELSTTDRIDLIMRWNSLFYPLYQLQPFMPIIELEKHQAQLAINHQAIEHQPNELKQRVEHEQRLKDNLEVINDSKITSIMLPQPNSLLEDEEDKEKNTDKEMLIFSKKENKAQNEQELIDGFNKIINLESSKVLKISEALKEIYVLFEHNKKSIKSRNSVFLKEIININFSIQICMSLLRASNNKVPTNLKIAMLWRLTKYTNKDYSDRQMQNISPFISLYYKIFNKKKKDDLDLLMNLKNTNYILATQVALGSKPVEDLRQINLSKDTPTLEDKPIPTPSISEINKEKPVNKLEERMLMATNAVNLMDAALLNQALNAGKSDKLLPLVFEIIKKQNVSQEEEVKYYNFISQIDLDLLKIAGLLENPQFASPAVKNAWGELVLDKIKNMLATSDSKIIEILSKFVYEKFIDYITLDKKTLLMIALEYKSKANILDFLIEKMGFYIIYGDEEGNNALHYWVNNFATEETLSASTINTFNKLYKKFDSEANAFVQKQIKAKKYDKQNIYLFMHALFKNKYEQSFLHMLLEYDNTPKVVKAVFNVVLSNSNVLGLMIQNADGDNVFTLLEEKPQEFSGLLDFLSEKFIENYELLAQHVTSTQYTIVRDLFNICGGSYLNSLLDDMAYVTEVQYNKNKEIVIRRMRLREKLIEKNTIFDKLGDDLLPMMYCAFAKLDGDNPEFMQLSKNLVRLKVECELKVPCKSVLASIVAELQDEPREVFINKFKVIFRMYNAILDQLQTCQNIQLIINKTDSNGSNRLTDIVALAAECKKHNDQESYIKSISLLKRWVELGIDLKSLQHPEYKANILHTVLIYYAHKAIDIQLVKNLIDNIVQFAGIDTLNFLLQQVSKLGTCPLEEIKTHCPEIIAQIDNLKAAMDALSGIESHSQSVSRNRLLSRS